MTNQDISHPTIFISYSETDRHHPVLERLVRNLLRKGASLLDVESIFSSGQSIADNLRARIVDSDYVIIALSRNSLPTTWVRMEYEFALSKELEDKSSRIIIISLDPSDLSQTHHDMVEDRGWIDLSSEFKVNFQYVKETIFKSTSDKIVSFDIDKPGQHQNIINVTSSIDRQLIEHFSKNPDELYSINPRTFEELVAELFRGFGYEIELTKQTRDGGRDIIAIKNDQLAYKHLIECKRYGPDKKISVGVVRALYGVKEHYQTTKAILATTAFFSKDAMLFFEDHRWELEPRDYDGITDWIKVYLHQMAMRRA